MSLSIVEGCEFLESRNIVHRALQAQRIMVGESYREIYIADLGAVRDIR
jgi:serine/threonine protein kinase